MDWRTAQAWAPVVVTLVLGVPTLIFSWRNYEISKREKRLTVRPRLHQALRKGEVYLDKPSPMYLKNIGGVGIETIEVQPHFYVFDFDAKMFKHRSIQTAGRLAKLLPGEEGTVSLLLDVGVRLMTADIAQEVAATGKRYRYAIVARIVTQYRRSVDYESYEEMSTLVLLEGATGFQDLYYAKVNKYDPKTREPTAEWVNEDVATMATLLEDEFRRDAPIRAAHGIRLLND